MLYLHNIVMRKARREINWTKLLVDECVHANLEKAL